MRIVTVVGARPQFVKAAIVSRALAESGGFDEVVVHTGQHFDDSMSAIFFRELGIQDPKINLGIGGGTHGQNSGRMIEAIEQVLLEQKPAFVLLYGDTDTTLAGAIAAAKIMIPIAHVEAGLRSFNRRMPEEINRLLADHCSDVLYTPTSTADSNLEREGIDAAKIVRVGDVMYDAALHYKDIACRTSGVLDRLELEPHGYCLATIHRKENTDDRNRLTAILAGLEKSPVPVILPAHPRLQRMLGQPLPDAGSQLRLIDPVGYLDMTMLEVHARIVATDSGGVQKEAYFHRRPCITLRDETEWTELLASGANILAGAVTERIAELLNAPWADAHWDTAQYGSGDAGMKIATDLAERARR